MTSGTSGSDGSLTPNPDIAFYGGAGAGKTTASSWLTDRLGHERLSFAQKLKELAVEFWGEDAFSDRGRLQALGSKLREIDEDIWVNYALKTLDEAYGEAGVFPVVNDDCRFPNEYWRLKERGFFFVRVLCKEEIRVDRLLRINKLDDPEQLNHESETALVGLNATREGIVDDFTVFNEGDLDSFHQQLESVLVQIEEMQ